MATALRPEPQPHDEIAVAGGCALCHGSRHKTFLIAKQRTVIECAECDLRALSPMPSLDKMVSVNEETVHPFFNACLEDEGSYRTYFSPKLDDLQRYQPAGRLLDVGCGAAASTPLSS